jgi:ribosomal protein L37AE/L43A
MNVHTFDKPSCPICHRSGAIKPHRLLTGLLTCEYCRERLVVSWSGHYVRDPFALKKIANGRMLRRASSPLARICRDFRLSGSSLAFVILGSAVLLGMILAALQTFSLEPLPLLPQSSSTLKSSLPPDP